MPGTQLPPQGIDFTGIGVPLEYISFVVGTAEPNVIKPANVLPTLADLQAISEILDEALSSTAVTPELKARCITVMSKFPQFKCCVSGTPDGELAQLVDSSDTTLCALGPKSPVSRKCFHWLRRAYGTLEILPASCIVAGTLLSTDDQPFASGALSDMYEGSLDGSNVCIQKVRTYSNGASQEARKRFFEVAVTWKHLRHKNIAPFLGATLDPPQLVSAWMPGRGLTEYLTTHPEKNRLGLLYDVARGLEYLHSHGVIHGDLKEQNILIDDDGHACIAGLDLCITTSDLESTISSAEVPAIGLAAPEILEGGTTITMEADIFLFGMVMIEAFTGAVPFAHSPPTAVAVGILSGKRPERPTHPSLTDELWDLIQRCWDQEPQLRPGISEVVGYLQAALATQGDCEDGTSVPTTVCTVSMNSRKRESSHRLYREPTVVRWLPVLYKSPGSLPKRQASLSKSPGMEFGEWEKPLNVPDAPSRSCGFLRRVAVWLSHTTSWFKHNRDGRLHGCSEERGATQKVEDRPPSICRSSVTLRSTTFQWSCLPLRGSSKYVD